MEQWFVKPFFFGFLKIGSKSEFFRIQENFQLNEIISLKKAANNHTRSGLPAAPFRPNDFSVL